MSDTARHIQPVPPYRNIGGDPELAAIVAKAQAEWVERFAQDAVAMETAEHKALREREAMVATTRQKAEQLQARLARLRTAGVPEDHVKMLVSQGLDKTGDAMVRSKRWRQGNRRILVLGGALGVGKSLAACWLLACGPRRPYPHPEGYDEPTWPSALAPRFILARRLARLDTYRSGELDLVEKCALLVVDEVGAGDVGSYDKWAERLDGIVSGRYDAALDTVMTTNLTRDEFRKAFGERLFDRVSGTCGTWEEFAGKSLRQKQESRISGEGTRT